MDWWILTWLRDNGYLWYDLGGAGDPNVNQYKRGLAGKNGSAEQFVGKFYVTVNSTTLLAFTLADKVWQVGAQINKRIKASKR